MIISLFKGLLHLRSEPFRVERPQELPNGTASMSRSLSPSNYSRVPIEMDILVLTWKLKSTQFISQTYLGLMMMLNWVRHGRERAARLTWIGLISIFLKFYIVSQINMFSLGSNWHWTWTGHPWTWTHGPIQKSAGPLDRTLSSTLGSWNFGKNRTELNFGITIHPSIESSESSVDCWSPVTKAVIPSPMHASTSCALAR